MIKCCQFLPSTQSMLAPRACQQHCPTKTFSEYLVETILAFVEALGRNVVILHSDQEPVLVQLLTAVQSRRVKRTLVRHGPKASHQSQDKIENAPSSSVPFEVGRCCKRATSSRHARESTFKSQVSRVVIICCTEEVAAITVVKQQQI